MDGFKILNEEHLFDLAKSRFAEAKVLCENSKFDGAIYLSGYAVELMLKRRIVRLLHWDNYPAGKDDTLRSFKTHDLNVLLKLSGLEKELQNRTVLYAKWQIVNKWNSEWRYKELGSLNGAEAFEIIEKTKEILNWINEK